VRSRRLPKKGNYYIRYREPDLPSPKKFPVATAGGAGVSLHSFFIVMSIGEPNVPFPWFKISKEPAPVGRGARLLMSIALASNSNL
jgi:hypothetical protein